MPSDTPRPPFDSPAQEAYLHLWRSYDRLRAIEDELFNRYDLSAQQYNALRLLSVVYPAGMQTMEIGRQLISRMPDMTRLLDRLNKRGLITRKRLPENRRVVEVFITKAGRKLLSDMSDEVLEMHEQQLGHLSPNQQKQLVKLLRLARKPHEDASCDWMDAVGAQSNA
ncbi:MarR family transcriptional regulator [Rubripirellula amarantea]|uniref:Multidrug resistance operon repressor n=1 Tax=Rubripirellula amarantea TaxID=2527999 RepID=A0A5C5WX73_9BACT|nr:MarR family transcriptional regulator [Rubripirellula amarantea]MDA8745808.1 MarR family transcriptional regulator [Rubripirellula amarantea]TWT55208.1 Multidrug resistance operon repressor [Rubripirellula amarantea]